MSAKPRFRYDFELVDQQGNVVDAWSELNLIPKLGLDVLIQAPFGDVAAIGSLYVGLFRNNVIPSMESKAADIPASLGEFTQYTEATRPLWERVYDDNGSYDNSANRAQFTFTQDQLIYGAFLVTESAKGSNAGLLLSVVRFPSPRSMYAGLTLNVTAVLTYVPTSLV
jgi:hypothetical protein